MIRATVVAVVTIAIAPAARGDTPTDRPTAVDLERWTATATGWWAGIDDARTLGLGHLAFALTASGITTPIALRSSAGEDIGSPVSRRASLIAAAAYGVTDAIELDASFPIMLQTGDTVDTPGVPPDVRTLTRGDLRLGGKFQIVDRAVLRAAFAADIVLPTGDDDNYAGEASWILHWRALAGLNVGRFGVAVAAGVRIRGEEVKLAEGQVAGNEIVAGAALAYQLPSIRGVYCAWTQLRAIAEIDAVFGDTVGDSNGPSPSEARFGVRGRIWRGWTVGVIGGRGLTDALGSPRWRAVIEVSWRDEPRSETPRAAAVEADPDDCDDDCD